MNPQTLSQLMPVLRPIRIETQDLGPFSGFWRWLTAKRTWAVAEDWQFLLPGGDPIYVIPAGFVFDGASIPRIFWWFLSPTGLLLIPGLVHDFAYRYDFLVRVGPEGEPGGQVMVGLGKAHWDRLFRVVTREINSVFLLHWVAWLAVSWGGAIAWRNNRKLNAPPYWE